jgi:hypothetical protein
VGEVRDWWRKKENWGSPDWDGFGWGSKVEPFNFVTPNLAVGGEIRTRKDVAQLRKAGITNVINVQGEFDDSAVRGSLPGIWLPVPDDLEPKPLDWWKAGVDYGVNVLRDPRRKLYVHCYAGINRSTGMTYAILRAQGWPREQAARAIQQARPVARTTYFGYADTALRQLGLLWSNP